MVKVGFIALPTTSCHVEQIPVLRSKRGIWSSPKSGCPNLSRPLRKGGRIRPSQYSNHAKGADQKLWCAWNQDNHRKRPTRTSIKALKQIDRIENELRIQCSDENARNSKIIATTWPIRMAPMPHTTNISVRPPATAPIPVAFCLEMPRSVWPKPTRIGTQGAQASTTPQRKRFFFSSSTEFPSCLSSVFRGR